MKKTKCLVTIAQKKCKCEWCNNFRKLRELNMKMYVSLKLHQAMMSGLRVLDEKEKSQQKANKPKKYLRVKKK